MAPVGVAAVSMGMSAQRAELPEILRNRDTALQRSSMYPVRIFGFSKRFHRACAVSKARSELSPETLQGAHVLTTRSIALLLTVW